MPKKDKITLAEAREKGKIDQFIKEHQSKGDKETVDRALRSMAPEKSSKARPASSRDEVDD